MNNSSISRNEFFNLSGLGLTGLFIEIAKRSIPFEFAPFDFEYSIHPVVEEMIREGRLDPSEIHDITDRDQLTGSSYEKTTDDQSELVSLQPLPWFRDPERIKSLFHPQRIGELFESDLSFIETEYQKICVQNDSCGVAIATTIRDMIVDGSYLENLREHRGEIRDYTELKNINKNNHSSLVDVLRKYWGQYYKHPEPDGPYRHLFIERNAQMYPYSLTRLVDDLVKDLGYEAIPLFKFKQMGERSARIRTRYHEVMQKGIDIIKQGGILIMFGMIYRGHFFAVTDLKMPKGGEYYQIRDALIVDTLGPKIDGVRKGFVGYKPKEAYFTPDSLLGVMGVKKIRTK